jgi:hypothetical protein
MDERALAPSSEHHLRYALRYAWGCNHPGDYLPYDQPSWLALDAAITELVQLRREREAERAALAAARKVADWLPGVWADYQGICRRHPDQPIPIEFEDMIHAIEAHGFDLRDALDAAVAVTVQES